MTAANAATLTKLFLVVLHKDANSPLTQFRAGASSEDELRGQILAMHPNASIVGLITGSEAFIGAMERVTPCSGVHALLPELVQALGEASAALPDAWAAVKCDVPRELIEKIDSIRERARLMGLETSGTDIPLKLAPIKVVCSGSEDFMICPYTGVILTPKAERAVEYRCYEQVDIVEYNRWAAAQGLSPPTSVDFVCVRLKRDDGTWEEAEEEARAEVVAVHQPRPLAQPLKSPLFSHMFSIAFTVTSPDPKGELVTPQEFRAALTSRMADLDRSGEWDEAVGAPDDTYKIED